MRSHCLQQLLACCADDAKVPATSEKMYVRPPAYQTDQGSFTLDLSCLVDGNEDCEDEDALDEIKAVDLHGYWPNQELQQMTTLDLSQLQALKVSMDIDTGEEQYRMRQQHRVFAGVPVRIQCNASNTLQCLVY